MTTDAQNQWAQMLEDVSAREIMTMAEYAIDHIEHMRDATALRAYLDEHIWCIEQQPNKEAAA